VAHEDIGKRVYEKLWLLILAAKVLETVSTAILWLLSSCFTVCLAQIALLPGTPKLIAGLFSAEVPGSLRLSIKVYETGESSFIYETLVLLWFGNPYLMSGVFLWVLGWKCLWRFIHLFAASIARTAGHTDPLN
jgi:hypothetical protein